MNKLLANNYKIPQIGYGVYKMPDAQETINNIIFAIKNGYRMIDTASRYGNESCVGQAIKQCGIAREELFITSKL
jgi:diketogulonate reductase-like aldo/keto reductase